MPAIGMLIAWSGYSFSLWGYCLIRGYDVKLSDLVNPVHPYTGPWPPPLITNPATLLPGRSSVSTTSTSSAGTSTSTGKKKKKTGGGGGGVTAV